MHRVTYQHSMRESVLESACFCKLLYNTLAKKVLRTINAVDALLCEYKLDPKAMAVLPRYQSFCVRFLINTLVWHEAKGFSYSYRDIILSFCAPCCSRLYHKSTVVFCGTNCSHQYLLVNDSCFTYIWVCLQMLFPN